MKSSRNPIRRRKGNRNAAHEGTQVVLYASGKRLEAQLLDESKNGIGVCITEPIELREKQPIRVMFRRRTLTARIANVTETELGLRVGIKF